MDARLLTLTFSRDCRCRFQETLPRCHTIVTELTSPRDHRPPLAEAGYTTPLSHRTKGHADFGDVLPRRRIGLDGIPM